LETPSGFSSIASGLETPDKIELRKDIKRGDETPDVAPKQLYTVIPQKEVKNPAAGFMGSAHTYDLSAALNPSKKDGKKGEGVEVALDPNEMETLDENKIKQLFDQQKMAEKDAEDLSDMVAEHAANQSKKRKKQSDSKSSKKSKDFKF
jgi:splicing factor 3B subunit 2